MKDQNKRDPGKLSQSEKFKIAVAGFLGAVALYNTDTIVDFLLDQPGPAQSQTRPFLPKLNP